MKKFFIALMASVALVGCGKDETTIQAYKRVLSLRK